MSLTDGSSFIDEDKARRARILPTATVMIGSLLTILPFIAHFPVLPPFGLMVLLGWKLARSEAFPIWAPVPLGFFDDLNSGQPIGSAVLLWTLCFFMIDLVDRRLAFRDFWQDWLIASGMIAFCLILGRAIASPIGAHVDTVLLAQIVVSCLIFPLVARLVASLDARRQRPV